MAGSVSLREFGFNFCGPLLWSYMQKVTEYVQKNECRVYCLAREGYLFKAALEQISPESKPVYLYASRTFLFRICLFNRGSWVYSIGHGFDGNLLDFFVSRFGFTLQEAESIIEGYEPTKTISLPLDREFIEGILEEKLQQIELLTRESRLSYLQYLSSVALTPKSDVSPLFLDVGYSGTIQKLLTLLLEIDTNAYYFITTDSKKNKVKDFNAFQQFAFKDGVKMGGGYVLLDRSMFLESLFTSPDGQFIDIRRNLNTNSGFEYFFGKRGYTQRHFEKLSQVFDGALEAISHYQCHNISFSTLELEAMYSKYVFRKNLIPSESWPLFEFDDAISGFGNVNPLVFFGL